MKPLTARELQIALLIADGHTNTEIGEQLGIATRTVKAVSDHVRWKLGVEHRRRIGAELRRRGLA